MIEIKNRYTGIVIQTVEADTLRWANLRGADLRGADLRGADLRWANLDSISISWADHTLLSEILFRAAGDDLRKQTLAGLIRLRTDWCWDDFREKCWAPDRDWAITELTKWAKDGDDCPEWVRGKQ